MTLFKEVVDTIGQIADSVDNMQKIIEAVRTGIGYLDSHYPYAKTNLVAMSEEIVKSLQALAAASAVVTRFSFTVSGSNLDREPRKFNDYFIANVKEASQVRERIEELRGHCHTVRGHAEELSRKAAERGLNSLFNFLNIRSAEKERELAERLQQIYNEEMELYLHVDGMSWAVEKAFEDVQRTLGPPGQMKPENVPAAAELLGQYGQKFRDLQSRCEASATTLRKAIDEVTK